MLVDARQGVMTLMTSRLPDLHALAGALLEHETLTADQIRDVLAGRPLQVLHPYLFSVSVYMLFHQCSYQVRDALAGRPLQMYACMYA
jgi:hypothetical protein